ncbi:MAG: hypothetical protein P4L42_12850 [Desulfocapsaceae bacterium]|nr:hypothetical protein [Desulfocapsaceae bacterium]
MQSRIAQKQPMVLIFGKMLPQQTHQEIDVRVYLLAGKASGENVGEFRLPGKLQKTGKGLSVKLIREAEAYLVWLDF